MRLRRKWLWALVCLTGVVVLVAYFIVLPLVVHSQLNKALTGAGIKDITFNVSSVSFDRTRITNIKAQNGASLKKLVISYTPIGLRNGRVTNVRAEGLEFSIDCKNGRANLGVIDEILTRQDQPATQPTSNPAAVQAALPFDQITLADSVVVLRTPRQDIRLPLTGTLMVQPDGKLLLSADALGTSSPIHLAGTIDPGTGWLDLHASCNDVDLPNLMPVLKELKPDFTTRITGNIAVDLRYMTGAFGNWLYARFDPKDLILRIPHGQDRVTKLQAEKGVLLTEVTWKIGTDLFGKLTTADLALASDDNAARVDGLALSLAYGKGMDSWQQSINVESAQVGQMKATKGAATFKVDEKHVVRVDQTQWTWLGGALSAKAFTIEPGAPTDVTIGGRAIELKPLLDLFGSGHVSGEGKIDLDLPMRINWPRIGFGRGSAHNAGPGRLRIAEAGNFANAVADGSGGRGQDEQEKLKHDVIEALQDFDYRVLNVTLRPSGSDLFADVQLAGSGRTGAKKALDLELHLSNVDDLVEFYLGISGKMSGQ